MMRKKEERKKKHRAGHHDGVAVAHRKSPGVGKPSLHQQAAVARLFGIRKHQALVNHKMV